MKRICTSSGRESDRRKSPRKAKRRWKGYGGSWNRARRNRNIGEPWRDSRRLGRVNSARSFSVLPFVFLQEALPTSWGIQASKGSVRALVARTPKAKNETRSPLLFSLCILICFSSAYGQAPLARPVPVPRPKPPVAEPDRTVTEAAIIALTVRSEASLLTELRQLRSKIKDVVLRDDLDNAVDVIEARARYLASPQGKNAGGSLEQAVRSYFTPALEPPRPASGPSKADVSKPRSESVASPGPITSPGPVPSKDRTSDDTVSAKRAGSEMRSAQANSSVPAKPSRPPA